jgi:hypothetical protein
MRPERRVRAGTNRTTSMSCLPPSETLATPAAAAEWRGREGGETGRSLSKPSGCSGERDHRLVPRHAAQDQLRRVHHLDPARRAAHQLPRQSDRDRGVEDGGPYVSGQATLTCTPGSAPSMGSERESATTAYLAVQYGALSVGTRPGPRRGAHGVTGALLHHDRAGGERSVPDTVQADVQDLARLAGVRSRASPPIAMPALLNW